jgi:hypothetical protein
MVAGLSFYLILPGYIDKIYLLCYTSTANYSSFTINENEGFCGLIATFGPWLK